MNQFAVHHKFSRRRHLLKILPVTGSAFNLNSKGLLTGYLRLLEGCHADSVGTNRNRIDYS